MFGEMYGNLMYSTSDKMMMNGSKPSSISAANCFSGRYSPTYRVPDQMRDPMRRCMTNPPGDIFGSLNDSGLLSRASEALMAVDVKHPVVSCSAAAVAAAAAASHGFTQIKSDMMYSHHTSSQSIMSSRGNQMDHPGMTGLDMLGSPHSSNGGSNGDVGGPPMTPLPPGMSDHIAAAAAQLGHHHHSMYNHSPSPATSASISAAVSSMMSSPHGHPHHHHHHHHHHAVSLHQHAHAVSVQDTETDPRELEAFAERFKQRRIKLGVTQSDVGKALANLKLPGVGALSQSTICRFESLTLSHNNMIALKPVLSAWLEEAEAAKRDPDRCGEKKRKRTSIAAPEKRSLEAYFMVQPRPSGEKIAAIAEKLDLKKNVVRVWFCNQRQKQKRMKFASAGQGQGGPGSGL